MNDLPTIDPSLGAREGTIDFRGNRVNFYGRLGCGNSDQPDDQSLWNRPLFVEDVGAFRDARGLDRLHLPGQSWVGCLR